MAELKARFLCSRVDFLGRYTEPNHPQGWRQVEAADESTTKVRVKGVDAKDGAEWTAEGEVCNGELVVDFSPSGPVNQVGRLRVDGNIQWPACDWSRMKTSSYAASFIAMHDLQNKLSEAVNHLVNDSSTGDPILRLSEILAAMAKPGALPEEKDMNAANKVGRHGGYAHRVVRQTAGHRNSRDTPAVNARRPHTRSVRSSTSRLSSSSSIRPRKRASRSSSRSSSCRTPRRRTRSATSRIRSASSSARCPTPCWCAAPELTTKSSSCRIRTASRPRYAVSLGCTRLSSTGGRGGTGDAGDQWLQ